MGVVDDVAADVLSPPEPSPPSTQARTPRRVRETPGRVDRWFNRVTLAAGLVVLLLLTLVGLFLLLRARTALSESGLWSFLTTEGWRTDVHPQEIGVLGMLVGTALVAVIAVTIALPFSVMAALFITEYSNAKTRQYLTAVVDLMAAIPSLLFGLWGFLYLSDEIVPLSRWLTDHLGFIPIFETDSGSRLTGSMFIAGIVVALMVMPIITSVVREVFGQTPPGEKEAALALGSTRWGMIRAVVLPYGRGGIIGGTMLGLGRALGETIAVALLLPQVPQVSAKILQNGGATVAGFIALRAGGDAFTVSGLMAAGLVLFVVTLATNLVASVIVARSRSGQGVEL
ncbi:MAG TPA: phosphate ABC transporter permease subunit PstC [Acidimicrobiia bacterium]|nr:phosphate ABC transporter permease subunit PstC [Acidimicrobiia bacterium]